MLKSIALSLGFAYIAVPAMARAEQRVPPNTLVSVAAADVLAPADRYFGRLRMSVLGIRNGVHDIAARIDRTDAAEIDVLANLYHKLTCVDDALLDLKEKFPRDTWIAPLGFDLAKAYMKLRGDDASVHANDTLDWIIADYPATDEATSARSARAARLSIPATNDVPIEP